MSLPLLFSLFIRGPEKTTVPSSGKERQYSPDWIRGTVPGDPHCSGTGALNLAPELPAPANCHDLGPAFGWRCGARVHATVQVELKRRRKQGAIRQKRWLDMQGWFSPWEISKCVKKHFPAVKNTFTFFLIFYLTLRLTTAYWKISALSQSTLWSWSLFPQRDMVMWGLERWSQPHLYSQI